MQANTQKASCRVTVHSSVRFFQDTYDKSVLNAAICIEIDVESGQVYSVFYGTNCKGLYYGSNGDSKPADMSGSWLDIDYSKRDRDTRRKNGWAITLFRMQSMLSVWMRPS